MLIIGVTVFLAVVCSVGWYFSPINRRDRAPYWIKYLSEQQRADLKTAGIKFQTGFRSERDSVFLPKKYLDDLCRVLNVYVLAKLPVLNTVMTELIIRPVLPDRSIHNGVQIRLMCQFTSHEYRAKTERLIKEIVLPVVNTHINVYNLDGSSNEPGNDDEFHLFINATPRHTRRAEMPNKLFGTSLNQNEVYALSPAFAGVPLIDPETNFVYGEVVGKSVYIFFNALPNSADKLVLFATLLENAAPEMNIEGGLEDALASVPQLPNARLVPKGNRGRVVQFNFKLHRRETATKLVKQILQPAVAGDVYVRDCRGVDQNPADDGTFHILYNSRPLAPGLIQADKSLPTGLGIPIITEDEFVGELIDRNFYVF